MIYNITNAGGAPNKLKMHIFGGTTQPSNPEENTIWVKTANPITEWLITATAGAWVTVNGAVNIVYEASSSYNFSNNEIIVYNDKLNGIYGQWWMRLLKCYQSNGSNLQPMDAYVYHNGAWTQFSSTWDGTLYYNGNQYTSVTGGWKGAQTTTPYLEEVNGCKPWNNDYNEGVICTANAIDLTNWKTLHIIGGGGGKDSESKYPMKAYVRKTYTGEDVATADFGDTALDSNTQRDIDISGLSGSYYILTGAAGNIRHSHRVVRVWLTA